MPKFKDLTGQRFARLTVVSRAENSKSNQTQWLCKCDCGNEAIVRSASLINGHTKSCGCYNDEIRKINTDQTTHGLCYTRIYRIWHGIKARCGNKNSKIYRYYGGKGVTLCEEWHDFMNFYNWAMGNGYADDLTIDRIDLNGNYEPSNCRWVDKYTQMNNMSTNKYYMYNGEKMTVPQISRATGVPAYVLQFRLDKLGYSLDKAVNKPIAYRKNNNRGVKLTMNGVSKPLSHWAKEYGIREATLYGRIYYRNWDIERALTEPTHSYQRRKEEIS